MKLSLPAALGLLASWQQPVFAAAAQASAFDGSKTLLCAPNEVIDCVAAPPDCWSGSPRLAGAPAFLRIDGAFVLFGSCTVP